MFVSDMTTVTCLNTQAKQFHKHLQRSVSAMCSAVCGAVATSSGAVVVTPTVRPSGLSPGLTSSKATSHRAGDLARPYHFSYRVLARWAQFSDSAHQAEKKQA